MSRSFKKPFEWISKRWTKFNERAFRRKTKMQCYDVEIDFDPDKDWLDAQVIGEFGTRCGWSVPPGDGDDTWMHESYVEMQRK